MSEEKDSFLKNLILELLDCSITDLQDIRMEWAAELERRGADNTLIDFAMYLTDLIIEKKQERMRAAG